MNAFNLMFSLETENTAPNMPTPGIMISCGLNGPMVSVILNHQNGIPENLGSIKNPQEMLLVADSIYRLLGYTPSAK